MVTGFVYFPSDLTSGGGGGITADDLNLGGSDPLPPANDGPLTADDFNLGGSDPLPPAGS